MGAYYNEIDPEKAEWIRELIKAGVVAPGDVDERDIKLVQPDDLRGYRQCHFFAGIAVWSYALRLAGWPDDREVWTGSCPCPSFSLAGEKQGLDDPRHLWPDWFRLIRERRPATVFGEQVDSAISFGWLDLVQSDLEAEMYAIGKAVLSSRYAKGEDERPRLYFVADSGSQGRERFVPHYCISRAEETPLTEFGNSGTFGRLSLDAYIRRLPPRNGTTVSLERGLLRGYGDAINAQVAKTFIEAYCETREQPPSTLVEGLLMEEER